MHSKTVLSDFLFLFFPQYCRGCNEPLVHGEQIVCSGCMLELPRSNYHLDPFNPFFIRLHGRLPVKSVMTFLKFVKTSRAQKLLHALKYKNQPEIGVQLGRVYGQDLLDADYGNRFDLIVPVPLFQAKKRKRGYNQSEEFGKGLGEILKVPCTEDYLKRTRGTLTQTRKSKLSRWNNVKEVFEVQKPEGVLGKRILLVDDVMTTGATLEACGEKLISAGCSELSIACIAATQ